MDHVLYLIKEEVCCPSMGKGQWLLIHHLLEEVENFVDKLQFSFFLPVRSSKNGIRYLCRKISMTMRVIVGENQGDRWYSYYNFFLKYLILVILKLNLVN